MLAPGWLLLRAISPHTRSLAWQVALGWPLGIVLEIAFFSLTAALDARDLFLAYPLLAGVPCALAWRRRAGSDRGPSTDSGFNVAQRWTIAGLCLTAFGYLALTLVAYTPLPGSVPAVFYPTDLMFHIALAAEAKHHWPLQDPLVAGGDLNYHYFFHLHAAAASQVTGIGLPVLVLRLCVFPLVALVVLQLSLAGRAISGIGWAGPLAAGLGLLVWELDLIVPEVAPLLGANDIWLWASPTYVLGLVFLVPLGVLIAAVVEREVLARISGPPTRRAAIVLIALLLLGAGGSKVTVIPVVAGGLALFLCWCLVRLRPVNRAAWVALALSAAVFVFYLATLYSGGGGSELRVDPGGIYELMPSLSLLERTIPDSLLAEIAFWGIGSVAATLLLFGAPLLGLYWILVKRTEPLRDGQGVLLFMLLAGLPAWFLLVTDTADNYYFAAYGIVAALPVVAEGLHRGFGGLLAGTGDSRRQVLQSAAVWIAVLLAAAFAGWELALADHPARAYVLAYGVLGIGLLAIAAYARWGPAARRNAAMTLLALAIVLAAGLDLVLDSVPTSARKVIEGDPLYSDAGGAYGFTPDMVRAAEWAREQTPEDAVLAVSNQRSPEGAALAPLRAEFTAFSERRTFHEGWAYSRGELPFREVTAGDAQPHPDRLMLEERIFYNGDERALRTIRDDYGVTHLVVDRENGAVPAEVYSFGRLVFSNSEVDIIELGSPQSGRGG